MVSSFPSALIECIKDARLPLDREIASLAAKIWDEGLRFVPGCSSDTAIRVALQALTAGVF